jgi:transcriptional regulator GlxA family with amidase domain
MKPPIGVLCSSDRIARELCNEARLMGMDIGNDLLVVGIGNEPAESTFAGIGLSSFDIPAREMGFRAAKEMKKIIGSRTTEAQKRTEKVAVTLIPRESTLPTPQARLAERAVAEMSESIAQADFDVASLCRRLGVSRRTLELATRERLGQSPYQILSAMRLSRAKELLLHSEQTIAQVGEECGYPAPHHFSAWFKQRARMAPKKFRLTRA